MPDNIKTATVVWKEGLAFEGTADGGLKVNLDSPAGAAGASPMGLLLVSLAGCTGMDVIDILRKKRQDVTGLEIQVSGTRAETHPRKYTAIRVHYVVTGHNVDPEAVRRSIELSETKYCSVLGTVSPAVPITTDFEIREAALAAA